MNMREVGSFIEWKRKLHNVRRFDISPDTIGASWHSLRRIEKGESAHTYSLFAVAEALNLEIIIREKGPTYTHSNDASYWRNYANELMIECEKMRSTIHDITSRLLIYGEKGLKQDA